MYVVILFATTFMYLHWTILWRRVPGMVAVLADWYHPYKNMLTEEQSVALEQLLLFADIRQAEVIRQILAEFSSQTYRQKYAKE